jgi:hypothetical protein
VITALLLAAGGVIVLAVLCDIFFTVLFPASGRGPIRKPLSRLIWACFRAAARRLPGRRRQHVLTYSGPVVITATLLTWGVLLVTGWALIAKPALGSAITAGHATDTSWASAFYYSTGLLTTLGTGNFTPGTSAYRLLQVTEAAIGLVSLTMVITYFLSVYNGVTARKTFSSALHHRTRGTGDAAVLLAALSTDGRLSDARNYLTDLGDSITQTLQTHRAYPVLRYFHFRQARYSLPRVLLLALDAASLLDAMLGAQDEARAISAATAAELSGSARELLTEIAPRAPGPGSASEDHRGRWQARYQAALATLAQARITVPRQAADGASRYIRLRGQWDPPLRALAADMAYPWPQIDRAQAVPGGQASGNAQTCAAGGRDARRGTPSSDEMGTG